MAITCPNATASRTTPEGYAQHQCSLVLQVTGIKSAWIGDHFAASCTGDDLTSSACAQVINSVLKNRLVLGWRQAAAPPGCAGCLSLDQALALIITRQGAAVAAQILAAAITAGMPQAQAEALATPGGK